MCSKTTWCPRISYVAYTHCAGTPSLCAKLAQLGWGQGSRLESSASWFPCPCTTTDHIDYCVSGRCLAYIYGPRDMQNSRKGNRPASRTSTWCVAVSIPLKITTCVAPRWEIPAETFTLGGWFGFILYRIGWPILWKQAFGVTLAV